jgi:hypothetical protein
MPPWRAEQLLLDWAVDEPWKHYDSFAQRNACTALCKRSLGAMASGVMPEDEVRAKVAKLRGE